MVRRNLQKGQHLILRRLQICYEFVDRHSGLVDDVAQYATRQVTAVLERYRGLPLWISLVPLSVIAAADPHDLEISPLESTNNIFCTKAREPAYATDTVTSR